MTEWLERAGRILFVVSVAALSCAPLVALADEAPSGEIVVGGEKPAPAEQPAAQESEEETTFTRHGLFVGAGPAYFSPLFSGDASPLGGAWGFSARLGYRFLDYVAFEAQYEWSQYGEDPLGGNIELTSNVATGNLKFMYPFGRFQPFVGGGVGIMTTSQFTGGFWKGVDLAGTEFAGRVNGGFDLFLSEGWSFYVDANWVIPSAELSDLEYISTGFGLRYTFPF